LIKLFGRHDFPHARLGDSDQLRAGDWVFAVGNPFLLATDFHPTVTYGIVSGVHRYQYPSGTLLEYADCIQTDASINPGNSGGPLFDSQGLLVGINGRGSFEKRGRVNVGVAYAISINQIKKFLGCLKGGRIVDHATLGARLTSQDDGAVIVADVLESSDAYRRGLRYGDEVVSFGGRPIRTVNAFKNILGTFPKGWRVPLTFRRQGQTFDVLVRLSGVHGTEELLEKMQGQVPIDPPLPEPEKNPGEQPGDQPAPGPSDRPSDRPGDRPGRPGDRRRPRPALPQREAARPMPDVVKQHFESKRGYANYYFNTLNRTRLHVALTAHGDFSSAAGEWLISGQLEGAGDAQFHVSDQQVSCALPGGELTLDASGDLTSATEPPGSGGLLAALYLWRRLLVLGPERFGSTYYYGTMPLAGHAEPVEVLVGTYGGVECQFMFDAQSGHLLAMEMLLDSDGDPCELYFFDYDKLDGRDLPRRLDVRYGDNVYAAFELVDFTLDKAPED
ncbi:MAG: trypsin-like peptidase domain-containing protein, partial [Pirellulales bacterium]